VDAGEKRFDREFQSRQSFAHLDRLLSQINFGLGRPEKISKVILSEAEMDIKKMLGGSAPCCARNRRAYLGVAW
jgi:hypothetical protein